jgi:hypothetical protein
MKGYGVSGEINWDLGGSELTAITAYRWWDRDPANDGDSTSLPVIVKAQQANRQRQFSEEVRLASKGQNTIDYVIGAYYFWQTAKGYGATGYGAAAPTWFVPAVPAAVGNAALNGYRGQLVLRTAHQVAGAVWPDRLAHHAHGHGLPRACASPMRRDRHVRTVGGQRAGYFGVPGSGANRNPDHPQHLQPGDPALRDAAQG